MAFFHAELLYLESPRWSSCWESVRLVRSTPVCQAQRCSRLAQKPPHPPSQALPSQTLARSSFLGREDRNSYLRTLCAMQASRERLVQGCPLRAWGAALLQKPGRERVCLVSDTACCLEASLTAAPAPDSRNFYETFHDTLPPSFFPFFTW